MDPGQKRKHVPIAPAPREDGVHGADGDGRHDRVGSPASARARRITTLVACDECRRKRTKYFFPPRPAATQRQLVANADMIEYCDGQRPCCGQCLRKGDECVYAAAEGETVLLSLRKRLSLLEDEHHKYRELLGLLRTKPEGESHEILRRIRKTDQPLLVLEEIKHAELLLSEPSPLSPMTARDMCDERLQRLNREALECSIISVPAKPWTDVADDGLVSELVSQYFIWDNAYLLPSIDQEAFVQDMRTCDPSTSRWCSALLVNAMCAHKSQDVERARVCGALTQQNLTERFLDEAKSLLDREQGRTSIPAAQALMLMFLTTMCLGRDRAGRIYRHYALDMVARLNIEAKYSALLKDGRQGARERELLSRALWGLFIFESRVAFFYFEPSQIPPPGILHPFSGHESPHPQRPGGNVDVLGRPFEESPCLVPIVPGIGAATCALSELFYEIMKHNAEERSEWGSDHDLRIQRKLYSRLKQLTQTWPQSFQVENNIAPSTCFLRMHENEVGWAIIQTLRHQTLFETPASQPGTTIADLCLHHCSSDSSIIDLYLARWPFHSLLWRHLYLSMQPLVLMFDNPAAVNIFARDCEMLLWGCRTYRICGHLLQALQAFAWAIGQRIPDSATRYLDGWTKEEAEVGDLPISFALPQQDDVKDLLAAESVGTENEEDQLGSLLKRWALE